MEIIKGTPITDINGKPIKAPKKEPEETETESDVKIIMVGGSDSSMAKAVIESLNEKAPEAVVYELEDYEMKQITENRIGNIVPDLDEYLGNPDNIAQAKRVATEIHKKFEERFTTGVGFVHIKAMKSETKFSWKQFNEMIATLDVFGFIEWENEKKEALKIVLTEQDIIANKKKETQMVFNLAIAKLDELKTYTKTKKDQAKIETLKKRLNLESILIG